MTAQPQAELSVADVAALHARSSAVDLADPESAWGRCVIESEPLAATLRAAGHPVWMIRVTGLNYPGREHWAVLIPDPADAAYPWDIGGGTVVDVTMRQFRSDRPHPYVCDLANWLDDITEGFNDHLSVQIGRDCNETDDEDLSDVWDTYVRDDIDPGPMRFPWHP